MKYILHIGICGFGNQLLGFKETLIISQKTNRKIILPYFIPHGTIKNKCNEYYDFETIFDKNHFQKYFEILDIQHEGLIDFLKNNLKNIYFMRDGDDFEPTNYYFQKALKNYNINYPFNKIKLKNTFITHENQFQELQNINDSILVIVGTFNNIKLSTCSKNGCVYCNYDNTFIDEYNYSTLSLIHSESIKQIADFYLQKNNLINYNGFHIRTPDNAHLTKMSFYKLYNNMFEYKVYYSILKYTNNNLPLYISIPPDGLQIKNMKIFNSNKVYKLDLFDDLFIFSIVELELLLKSKILIYSPSNTPHNKQLHQRSSFTLHIKELRKILNLDNDDINIYQIYQ